MILRRFTPDGRRARAHGNAPPGPLRDYLACPYPDPGTDVSGLRLLAVDVETTGLNPARDRLLSIGFVPLNGLVIDLSGAEHRLVRADRDVGQSAVVHGLTDDLLADGSDLESILEVVLTALTGRLLLAHFTDIEEGFLNAACQRVYGARFRCLSVDTMSLQRQINGVSWNDAPTGSLRLPACREGLDLPRYRSHNALTDALACAELYLAQVARLGGDRSLTLKQLCD